VLEGPKIENIGKLDQERIAVLERKTLFWDQQYSLIWKKGILVSSRKALAEQEKWNIEGKIKNIE
jgi:hypothetical protein